MFAQFRMVWASVRDSLWFLPAVLTLLASGLALGLVKLDSVYNIDLVEGGHWLMGGSVDGARAILSTIAGSLITVTGVVFSITIVALQLASSQFTPRVLRNFLADRSNQLVLGVFIATFTYALLVLRVVRSMDQREPFVPELSVAVAIVLALVSIGFLIHFIHHAASSIQIGVILARVTSDALETVEKLFPEHVGKPHVLPPSAADIPVGGSEVVDALDEGYLQAVDGKSLFALGERQKILIQMTPCVGMFIVQGMPLAKVWSETELNEDTIERIRDAFIIGEQRSPEQDLEFYVIEISDIAVKALSPGINDPTTACHCIDRLTQLLRAMGKRDSPSPLRTKQGKIHFVARATTFEQVLQLAFSQILHFGRDNPAIVRKLGDSLQILHDLLPTNRHPPLHELRAAIGNRGSGIGNREERGGGPKRPVDLIDAGRTLEDSAG
jgi:uncharacterized membrane protein